MRTTGATATIFLALSAAPLAAQAWDAPTFLAPEPADDLGAYFVDPEGGDWGLVGIWRQSGDVHLGLRAGILDVADDLGVALGAEAWDVVLRGPEDLPVEAAWTLGFGATISDATLLRVPVGVTIGGAFEAEGWTLTPYVHPRLAIDVVADNDETDTDLAFTTDLGANLALGARWIIRAGISLIDRDAIGVGIAYRTARAVEVSAR